MRVMVIVKGDKNSEAGVLPDKITYQVTVAHPGSCFH